MESLRDTARGRNSELNAFRHSQCQLAVLLQLAKFRKEDSGYSYRSHYILYVLASLLPVGCEIQQLSVQGQVTADGVPIDSGVVSFQPAEGGTAHGTSIEGGRFAFKKKSELPAGKYIVTVQGFQKTGHTFNDPQRGPVAIKTQLPIRNNGQEVEITAENSSELQLTFLTN